MSCEEARKNRSSLVRTAQIKVDTIDAMLREALDERAKILLSVHGKKAEGFLSYQDIADASGVDADGKPALGKGRIIQLIQRQRQEV